MSAPTIPKTIAEGFTKVTENGRIISRNHPNPNGEQRNRKAYRSMKSERAALLPNNYVPRNGHPQNGDYQCPVQGCTKAFTRKAGLINHLQRIGGHSEDSLRDNGDGTFMKLEVINDNDMNEANEAGAAEGMFSHSGAPRHLNVNEGNRDGLGGASVTSSNTSFRGHVVEDHDIKGHVDEDYVVEGYVAKGHVAEGYADEGSVDEGHGVEGYADEGHVVEGFRQADATIDIFHSLGLVENFGNEEDLTGGALEEYKRLRYVTIDDLVNELSL